MAVARFVRRRPISLTQGSGAKPCSRSTICKDSSIAQQPQVKALYEDFLERPYSEKAHQLLHTYYTDRHVNMVRKVKDIWNEITMSTMVY